MAQLDARPTSDQDVQPPAGSAPFFHGDFFRGDLIMEYFLRSFSPFR